MMCVVVFVGVNSTFTHLVFPIDGIRDMEAGNLVRLLRETLARLRNGGGADVGAGAGGAGAGAGGDGGEGSDDDEWVLNDEID